MNQIRLFKFNFNRTPRMNNNTTVCFVKTECIKKLDFSV